MKLSDIDRAMAVGILMGEERNLVGMGIVAASGINRARSFAARGGGFNSRSARLGDVFAAPFFSEDMVAAVMNERNLPAKGRQYSATINKNIRGASTFAYEAFEKGVLAELGYPSPKGAYASRYDKAKVALDIAVKADDLGIDLGFGATNYAVKGFERKAGVGGNAGRFGVHRVGPFDRGTRAPREKDFARQFAAAAALTGVDIPQHMQAEVTRHVSPTEVAMEASVMQKAAQENLRAQGIESFPTIDYSATAPSLGLNMDLKAAPMRVDPMGPLDFARQMGVQPQSQITAPDLPDVPALQMGFPQDLGRVPDVPAPFEGAVPVARGQEVGNALFDAVTDARIGSPTSEVTPQPAPLQMGYPDIPATTPEVPNAARAVEAAVSRDLKDQQDREQFAEAAIDAQARSVPDVPAPFSEGPPQSFGAVDPDRNKSVASLAELQEQEQRDQRIKDFEEGRYAKGFGTTAPDFDKMASDLTAEIRRDATPVTSVTPVTPDIRATPAQIGDVPAPAAPPASLAPSRARTEIVSRDVAPPLPDPVSIPSAPRVFDGPLPSETPRARTDFATEQPVAPQKDEGFLGGLFGGLGGLFGDNKDGTLGGGLLGGLGGALTGGLGGLFGGLGGLFDGFGGRNEFGGEIDTGFGAMEAARESRGDSWGGFGGDNYGSIEGIGGLGYGDNPGTNGGIGGNGRFNN